MHLYKIAKSSVLLLVVIILSFSDIYAHNKTIKGSVYIKNGTKEPVVGATVKIKNTVIGSITNAKGQFTLKKVPDGNFEVVVSAVGMKTMNKTIEIKHEAGDEIEMEFEMEENPVQTSNVVITATRNEKIYEDVPVKVSTIDAKAMEITSSSNLKEGLKYQPGLRTETNCQNCGFSQVRINGMEGKYSQILIDGKAIFSSLNGVYGLEQIPAAMIERIEVVRGGGSSLYGGNAIAGVINVITKEPCINSFSTDYSRQFIDNSVPEQVLNMNANMINDNQSIGISLFGSLIKRNEFDANHDGFSDIARLNLNTFGSKIFWRLNPKMKFVAEFNAINHEIRGGNKIDIAPHETDITEMANHKTYMGQAGLEYYLFDNSKINSYISFQTTNRNSYYGANHDLNAYGYTENQTFAAGFQITHMWNTWGAHVLTSGYELNYDEISDLAPAYNREIHQLVNTNSLYIQDEWILTDDFNTILGLRFDKNKMVDNIIVNPRFSAMYKLTEDLTIRGTFSTGYRSPQAFDEDLHIVQVGGEGVVIKINQGLKPEYSYSLTGSADYSFKSLGLPIAFAVDYFYTNLDDAFILEDAGFDSKNNRILLRKNGEGGKVYGFTAELQTQISNEFMFKIGATSQKSEFSSDVEWSAGDSTKGNSAQYSKKFFRAPDIYGFFLGSLEMIENFYFDFSGSYTGAMLVPHYAGFIKTDYLKKTDDFFEMNIKFSYSFAKDPRITFSLGFNNLFNSFQKDFDKGINRDAGYIYGPARPFSSLFTIKVDA